MKALHIGLIAAAMAFGLAAPAFAQAQREQQLQTPQIQRQNPGRLTARAPDLRPIPSRIEHGAISVNNAGAANAAASIVTVNCHLPGEEGGCPEIPAAALAAYTNAAYPNRLVINMPAIQQGHTETHYLSFWDDVTWPSDSYVFEFVVDAGSTIGETNEGNNSGEHTWVVPYNTTNASRSSFRIAPAAVRNDEKAGIAHRPIRLTPSRTAGLQARFSSSIAKLNRSERV
jgi:hypothetical protein